MKRYIVTFILMVCFATGLRASESTSPKEYLKKENYEIIEVDLSKYRNGTFDGATVNENGLVIFAGEGEGSIPIYFDPAKKMIRQCDSLLNEGMIIGITDKNQIYGRTRDANFIWSTNGSKLEFFGGYPIFRLFNDGSYMTFDGWKIDTEATAKALHGRYFSMANKNGQYPSDEFVAKASEMMKKDEFNSQFYPIVYNSKGHLLLSAQRDGVSGTTLIADSNGIHPLINPQGDGFQVNAYSLNDYGVTCGCTCLTKPDQISDWQMKARLWHNENVYFLSDIFGGDYSNVIAINNRGDMVVRGPRLQYSYGKPYVFLRKHSQKSGNSNPKKTTTPTKSHKTKAVAQR